VCVYSVLVLFRVQAAALQRDDPCPGSPTGCIGLRNSKSGQGPKGCRAIEDRDRIWMAEREPQRLY
jgi:hypothetical protein